MVAFIFDDLMQNEVGLPLVSQPILEYDADIDWSLVQTRHEFVYLA